MSKNVYEGREPFIFVSYSHKDGKQVLPIIKGLSQMGFRIWYDEGIEAGTEWPAYIEEHLESCASVLVFLSDNSIESINCRNEINVSAELKKDMLVAQLTENVTYKYGMRLQLSSIQKIFCSRHDSIDSLLDELSNARTLAPCKTALSASHDPSIPTPAQQTAPKLSESTPNAKDFIIDNGFLERYTGHDSTVIIPEGITGISLFVFNDCSELTNIVIPSNVKFISSFAFSGCPKLSNITVKPENTVYHSKYNCLIKTEKNELILGGKDCVIPRYVTGIQECAFFARTELKEITIPNNVTFIGDSAFFSCTGLKNVLIPNSVTNIGNLAFANCTSLPSLFISHGVTKIGKCAFKGCTSLTSVIIPNSVTSIGDDAFKDDPDLTVLVHKGSYAEQYAKENKIPFQSL